MSEIDWDRPLEAYHEDGRVADVTVLDWYKGHIHCDAMPYDGRWWFAEDGSTVLHGWRIRNVTEPKVDIEAWAYSIVSDLYDAEGQGMHGYTRLRDAFARYIMTKEEAPVDPDEVIAAVMAKHAEPDMVTILADARLSSLQSHILAAIKRGRELERGEVK